MPDSGVVLCGGRSSRMGRPKALLPWRGGTLVEHGVEVLRTVVDDVVVVSTPTLSLPDLGAGVRVVEDREPGLGPLAGIREGLEAIRGDRAFVTSTDAPFLTPDTVRALLRHPDPAVAVVDDHVQTLCAVYPRAGAAVAAELLASGRARPLFLLEAFDFRRVAPDELPDAGALRSLNTPADYLAAVHEAGLAAPATVELFGEARRALGRRQIELPAGRLGELLARVPGPLELLCDGELSRAHAVSLGGRAFVRDLEVPVGPGERILVVDAAAGG